MSDHPNDRDAVARQLGRPPRPFRVAARCPFGFPSVIENERTLNMPTSFWITCPSLDKAIARLESAGGVRAAQEEIGGETVEEVHVAHLARCGIRVAGVREGGHVKCLHAFTALHLSGAISNPVAEWTLHRLEKPYPEDACCTSKARRPDWYTPD
ncbi:MAG: DUF501 domain-containing protein [Actinobacteria bacterium]|nr:DUF501 domain-containing protein [Actinomycetota bacterium]